MDTPSVEIVRNKLTAGFEAALFDAALRNLQDDGSPLRFNNFAYAARESIRHVLCRLAPDSKVVLCNWYSDETGRANGVTRRQRAQYAIQGGLSDDYVKNSLELDVEAMHSRLKKAVDALNKFTHIQPETFGLEDEAVNKLSIQVLDAIADLLTAIDECRSRVLKRLVDQLDQAAVEQVLADPLVSVNSLASHFSLEDISLATLRVADIDHERILFEAQGVVHCILQFGSNSDLRRGDGGELPQSFKFRSELYSTVESPDDIEVDENSVGVDTSEWERMRYGLDEREDD